MASEPPNDMTTCEQIQVAHEMWAHGAQASIDAGDVERHASGCDVCGPYVAQSRKIDTMTAIASPTIDFSELRDRILAEVPQAKRMHYLVIAMTVAAVVFGVLTEAPLIVISMATFGLVTYFKSRKRITDFAGVGALAHADQLALWRRDLTRQLRELNLILAFLPVLFIGSISFAVAGHVDALMMSVLLIPFVFFTLLGRKKLRAELASWH